MKECDRFPIPEALMGRGKYQHFTLRVDSMCSAAFNYNNINKWSAVELDTYAPYNSVESEE